MKSNFQNVAKRISSFLCALLVIMAIVTISVPAAAVDDATMLYNGLELPNIDTVWTNKARYPCATIYESSVGETLLLLYRQSAYFSNDGNYYYYAPFELYRLSGGSWVLRNSSWGSDNGKYFLTGGIYWTSVDIYFEDSAQIYFAATDPEPVSGPPSVDRVEISIVSPGPFYPGSEVQLKAEVIGTNIELGSPESTVYWYVHGEDAWLSYIDNDGLLTIANYETAMELEIEAISTYDSTKSATITVPITYPLDLQIVPSQTTLITSSKRQEIQFELRLPNGRPFDYRLLEWTTPGADGQYFRIDDNGILEILPGAPAGTVTVKYAYQDDPGNVSSSSATVTIITQEEGIYDQLKPTPEQNDKAEGMEGAIGDAADKLENNNSSLGQLTPTPPYIDTSLDFDEGYMNAVSPLVTNIWSISGLGGMISIVLVVATVAYIFFGKRDG